MLSYFSVELGTSQEREVRQPPGRPPFGQAVGFLLSQLGAAVSARFKSRLASLDMEPRHFALMRAIEPVCPKEQFVEALKRVPVVVRGPKPAAVLRELGVPIALHVPEPGLGRTTIR